MVHLDLARGVCATEHDWSNVILFFTDTADNPGTHQHMLRKESKWLRIIVDLVCYGVGTRLSMCVPWNLPLRTPLMPEIKDTPSIRTLSRLL